MGGLLGHAEHRPDLRPRTIGVTGVANRTEQCGIDIVSLFHQLGKVPFSTTRTDSGTRNHSSPKASTCTASRFALVTQALNTPPAHAILEVTGLSAGYGPMRVIHDLDLTVMAGERTGIVGLNGHGKSIATRPGRQDSTRTYL